MSALPIPVEFELPNANWRPVRPDEWGVTNAAFMAVRDNIDGDYVPVLTIAGGWRLDEAPLDAIADESLEVAATQATEVVLHSRDDVGVPEAPAVVQVLNLGAVVDGRRYDLKQGQVLSALLDVNDPAKRAVLTYTVTCASEQFGVVAPEFQEFMGSVRPVLEPTDQVGEGHDEG